MRLPAFLLLLVALAFSASPRAVNAQSSVYVCVGPPGIGACAPVSATNPLPTTGGTSGVFPTTCSEPTDTTGTLTNVNDTVIATNLDGYATTLLTLKGTYSGATVKFQFSDDGGTTWFDVLGNANAAGSRLSTVILATNASTSFTINPGPGADSMRVVLTAISTGSITTHFSVNSCPTTNGVTATLDSQTYTSSSALAANQVLKATPGTLASFEVSADSTLSAAAWWIMIYDAASAPADGAVTPAKCYGMASGTVSFSAGWAQPVAFLTGMVIGVSTTGCFTKTASTHAFISGDYK